MYHVVQDFYVSYLPYVVQKPLNVLIIPYMVQIKEIQKRLNTSVLCWLATCDAEGHPSVSPKEIFKLIEDDHLLIANIASPQSMKNVVANPKVCVSFIDILVQKGFKLYGKAELIKKGSPEFADLAPQLEELTQGLFPFNSLFKIKIEQSKPILAPRYLLYPETTEEQQMASAKKLYGL